MEIDIRIGNDSMTINIENPYRFDTSRIVKNIMDFGLKCGVDLKGLGIERFIPRMIRGVAGCEGGCPSDARAFVKEGFGNFRVSYIEGGY